MTPQKLFARIILPDEDKNTHAIKVIEVSKLATKNNVKARHMCCMQRICATVTLHATHEATHSGYE